MFRSWKLGTAFGIRLYVHWSFWLLLTLLFFVSLRFGQAELAWWTLSLVVSIFGCVLLHELGHALVARHFGIDTQDITLYAIGGVARLERMSEKPREEVWIALAGPAVNVVLATLLLGARFLLSIGFSSAAPSGAGDYLLALGLANLYLLGFNLVPAFPMDGGRVLRALLISRLGRLRATRVAVRLASILMAVFVVVGCYQSLPLLVVVAFFILISGARELSLVESQERARRLAAVEIRPVCISAPVPLPVVIHRENW